jgi:C4-dicarboxylate-specific signal transduction histidine kinase
MPDELTSVRDIQQSLLWTAAAVACFNGSIDGREVRVRWNAALRSAFGLNANQSLRGGPLQNARIDSADRDKINQVYDALIDRNLSVDLSIHAKVNNGRKLFRLAIRRIPDTNRIVGVLQEERTAADSTAREVSLNRWQSVGRLTLLDEVAAAMAHELNQPLAAIATFSQAGERLLNLPEPRFEKAREVFQEVSKQALRAGELIRHMRGLVKRQAPGRTQLSIADLCKGFAEIAEPIARTHHVEFRVAAGLPHVIIEIDVTQINQVLGILFQNAVDALMDESLPRKAITMAAELIRDAVVISIIDSGRGIGAGVAPQLFQPFFSTKENGTGLGLISARNILEIYGSRLEFTNLPDGGCKFAFSLPLSKKI